MPGCGGRAPAGRCRGCGRRGRRGNGELDPADAHLHRSRRGSRRSLPRLGSGNRGARDFAPRRGSRRKCGDDPFALGLPDGDGAVPDDDSALSGVFTAEVDDAIEVDDPRRRCDRRGGRRVASRWLITPLEWRGSDRCRCSGHRVVPLRRSLLGGGGRQRRRGGERRPLRLRSPGRGGLGGRDRQALRGCRCGRRRCGHGWRLRRTCRCGVRSAVRRGAVHDERPREQLRQRRARGQRCRLPGDQPGQVPGHETSAISARYSCRRGRGRASTSGSVQP